MVIGEWLEVIEGRITIILLGHTDNTESTDDNLNVNDNFVWLEKNV